MSIFTIYGKYKSHDYFLHLIFDPDFPYYISCSNNLISKYL